MTLDTFKKLTWRIFRNFYYDKLFFSSLKTQDNLETVKTIPEDKLLLETDCPWCEVRPTHAGYAYIKPENLLKSVKKEKWNAESLVKGRNEPCNIRYLFSVLKSGYKMLSVYILVYFLIFTDMFWTLWLKQENKTPYIYQMSSTIIQWNYSFPISRNIL